MKVFDPDLASSTSLTESLEMFTVCGQVNGVSVVEHLQSNDPEFQTLTFGKNWSFSSREDLL